TARGDWSQAPTRPTPHLSQRCSIVSVMSILSVQDVTKAFATVRAVAGVSFDVRRGEIFALLGPNGAGKTTLIRLLLGILKPDTRSITYRIRDDVPPEPRLADRGYLPEDRGLYKDIAIGRTLTY